MSSIEDLKKRADTYFQSQEFSQSIVGRPPFEQVDYRIYDHLRGVNPEGFDRVVSHRIALHQVGTVDWLMLLGVSGVGKTALIGGILNDCLKNGRTAVFNFGLKEGISAARRRGFLGSDQGRIADEEYEAVGMALDDFRWAAMRYLRDGVVIEDNVPDGENFDEKGEPIGPPRVGVGRLRNFAKKTNRVSLVFITSEDKHLMDKNMARRERDLELIAEGRQKGVSDEEIAKQIQQAHAEEGIVEGPNKAEMVIDGALRQGNKLTLEQQLEAGVETTTRLVMKGLVPLPLIVRRYSPREIKKALSANNYKFYLKYYQKMVYSRLIECILGDEHKAQRGDYKALILSNDEVLGMERNDFKTLSQEQSLVAELRRLAVLPENEGLREVFLRWGERI